jgi:dienelactone hydrolase
MSVESPIHRQITENGLVGELVTHAGQGPFPAVLCIGGSSGGIAAEIAEPLTREGFAVMALGYFGLKGLPATFAELPLEYFERAVNWLMAQPEVRGNKIGVIGSSRGSEAALQLATLSPHIGAVAAYVPSGIRWSGVKRKAPWTYKGEPLPYAPWLGISPREEDGAIVKVDIFNQVLDKPELYEDAIIAVEEASCPILLISGKDDKLWPSERMADLIVQRLKEHDYPYECRHTAYANAGHRIKTPGLADSRYTPVSEDTVTHEILSLGGTLEGNKLASEKSFEGMARFFKESILG